MITKKIFEVNMAAQSLANELDGLCQFLKDDSSWRNHPETQSVVDQIQNSFRLTKFLDQMDKVEEKLENA